LGLAGLATGAGCAFPPQWQWRGSQINPSQLRGQPRLEPRSLLSFGLGRRTSKVQGYRGSVNLTTVALHAFLHALFRVPFTG